MAASPGDIRTAKPRRHLNLILIFTSITSCLISIAFLLWGLILEGPAFYNGQECSMTYSQFQFLPIRVLPWASSRDDVEQINSRRSSNRYRLLKFTDARDPRHQHLYKISGSMIENYDSQSNPKRRTRNVADEGRLLEFHDNWCLLPPNLAKSQWKDAPHPHRGHPVLYVPGHWGSFSQARSIGAHGTRWTGGSMNHDRSLYQIYNSFKTGEGMHDGTDLLANKTQEEFIAFLQSSYSKSYLDDFVMDVFSLDFDGGEGAALHSSKLFRQAKFFARAVETLVEGCQHSNTGDSSANDKVQGITIVAHSIGAWVVRIALKLHPHLTEKGWVKNVITLASPLSSVPYAVDAGVHDIVNHLNNENRGNGDVTFISISGGLRDEMIPPEPCEIPSAFEDRNAIRAQGDMSTTASIISEAFLATTIMKVNSDTDVDNQYGMDHRAIVWCYDLLKVVRKVIFTLVATTDQGITAPNRLNVANIVMLGRTSHKKRSPSFFRKETHQQWDQLVTDRGYARTTAIQLASPYNLNSLLKLTILSPMLDLHILAPLKRYWSVGKRRKEHATSPAGPYLTTFLDTTKSLFLIPLLVLSIFSTRRLSRSFWDTDDVSNCRSHECQVLLGTVFVLSQTSAMLYSFICLAVSSPALRGFFRRCSSMKKSNNTCSSEKDKPMGHLFGAIILQFIIQQARYLILCIVPSLTGGYYAFQHFVNGSENDLVWNEVSFSSYCFISVVVLVLSCLFKGLFISYYSNSQQECRVLFILLVSIVKATYGSVLYALSSTTHWGQMHSNLYNEFLNATKRTIVGYQNELFICLLKYLLPALLALDALLTYANMKQKARLQFSSAKDHGDDVLLYFKAIAKVDRERHIILKVVKSSLAMWYAWSVFESNSQDDIIIPAYSTITFVTYFLNSVPLSSASLDIFSAVVSKDLSFHCNVPTNHNKNE
ncbi:hypothetical protein HJC23_005188 [Cyclotella cryptica]|uniref:GPI inositol-deacylase n=1 Tax=Cyclotella cryptica TaxID=29204 RepID=A0ABD3NPK8_9STRA|eukprot:CCRYP_020336-RA/>CCRYP_020336-RA protein AED:0.00 eAED:0.00 QI:87/-1/1/1/-1/1/1/18/937